MPIIPPGPSALEPLVDLRKDCYWPRKFTEGQNAETKSVNRPYINELRGAWEALDGGEDENEYEGVGDEGDDENLVTNDNEDSTLDETDEPLKEEDSSVARIFMRGRCHLDMSETYHKQAEDIESFCAHINLNDLQKPDATVRKAEPLALLTERSQAGVSRENKGTMNEQQLYTALKDDRLTVGITLDTLGKDSEPQKLVDAQPSADQRRLYIHNITPHAAAVVMATTSRHEAAAIRDLIYLHLTSGTEIRVLIPSHGFQTFTFTLSIPYYTIKRGHQLSDDRQWPNGELLRKAMDIHILGKSRSTSALVDVVEKLHAAQTTITLTGIDEQRWTAIGLVDSIRLAESVRQYNANLMPDGGQREDPIAGKKLLPNNRTFDPRLYFLWVWEARVTQIITEWESIVACVDRTVTCMWHDDSQTLTMSDNPDETSQRLRGSILKKARLVSELSPLKHTLSKTVGAWRQFCKGDIKYFQDATTQTEAVGRIRDTLRAITGIYTRLQMKLEELENLIIGLDNNHLNNALAAESSRQTQLFSKQNLDLSHAQTEGSILSNGLAIENIEVSRQIRALSAESLILVQNQEKTGHVARRLTNTSMCFLPFMLAFSLFSMSPAALPFVPNWKALVFSLAMFMAVTLLLVNFWDAICNWLRSQSNVGSKIWAATYGHLGSFGRQRQQGRDIENTNRSTN